ncbi:fumarylacetoacetate hydrolase family protein [Nocardia jiangxiensis]|uniref:Fumarylacetoacetate hydrolase family protein n=1 Tax=Nocardia jiangxiensis TaxID=282685 RepID=A0ABW6SEF9_9NOCA|nr:fumarylacetoacetate hydrolase family protein [Nocardia jiangxiensis]
MQSLSTFPSGLATISLDSAPTLAIWANGHVLPLAEAAPRVGSDSVPGSARTALLDWESWCSLIDRVSADVGGEGWLPDTEVEFRPAIDASTVYCTAANYHDHIREMSGTTERSQARAPLYFLAPPASLAGHRGAAARPDGCQRFDWEVELAVVIGRRAWQVPAGDAYTVIAGYAVADDLSLRDFARREDTPFFPDWLGMKGHAGCTPIGPVLVPAAAVPDPMNLELSLSVNGERRQHSNTAEMIFSIAEQIEYLSGIVPLRPGDVILTGTPAGTGAAWKSFLAPGDTVVAEIGGVGQLETRIVAAEDADVDNQAVTSGAGRGGPR